MADTIINIDEGDVNADWIKLANPAAQKQELAIHAALAKKFAAEEKATLSTSAGSRKPTDTSTTDSAA